MSNQDSPLETMEPAAEAAVAPFIRTPGTRLTNYERLDETARLLGSPPNAIPFRDLMTHVRLKFPETLKSSPESLMSSLDTETINVGARARKAHDLTIPARWNQRPAFIKVGRAEYLRLTAEERELVRRLWAAREPILMQSSFSHDDWLQVTKHVNASR